MKVSRSVEWFKVRDLLGIPGKGPGQSWAGCQDPGSHLPWS